MAGRMVMDAVNINAGTLDPMVADGMAMAVDIMENADYLRVELHVAAGTEMITKLEDFLRRRSKITQVIPEAEVRASAGLTEVAGILFGDRADERLEEYLGAAAPGVRPG